MASEIVEAIRWASAEELLAGLCARGATSRKLSGGEVKVSVRIRVDQPGVERRVRRPKEKVYKW